jgi:hypothetical protein
MNAVEEPRVFYLIKHPGTLERYAFDSIEDAKKLYEGFNPITTVYSMPPDMNVLKHCKEIVHNWLDHYPEDIFPADGKSVDCASARMARHICKRLLEQFSELDPSCPK